jgi:putative ABC transport system permease protein
MTSWRLAIKEIRRNPFRTVLIALAVAVAAGSMTAAAVLIAGANQSVKKTVGRLGADLMVVPKGEKIAQELNEALVTGKPASFHLAPAAAAALADMPDVQVASRQTFIETLSNASCCAGKFFLVGFDPETDFTVTPWLRGGKLDPPPGSDNWMIVGDRITLRKGDQARFYGTVFTVAGVLEPTGMGMDWTVYLPEKGMRNMVADSGAKAEMKLRMADGAASAVFVKTAPGTDTIDLAERIEQADAGVQVVLSSAVAGRARRRMAGVAPILLAVIGGMWVMALVLTGVLFSQAVKDRQGEIGLLMAKGADRRFVLGLLSREAMLIALSAAAAGSAVGFGVVAWFRRSLAELLGTMDVLPSASTAVGFLAAVTAAVGASAVVASIAPALGVLRMEPYEAIRGGKLA